MMIFLINFQNNPYIFGEILSLIHTIILAVFFILYMHHNVFLILSPFCKPRIYQDTNTYHKYAYIVAAKNEEKVIGNLIDSINNQNYPQDKMTIFVFADNCTDDTAKIAREKGAIVYERKNDTLIGKSYVLDEAFKWLIKNYDNEFEAFIVFDADNLVDKNFTLEMNKAYSEGCKLCTSFRNSKNYGENWIASASAMLFFREVRVMHNMRSYFKSTTYVSGTGFLVDYNIIKNNGGWIHHRLIEDVEFSIDEFLQGQKTAYVSKATFYDEQPANFKTSWNQRMRWCKGNHQCFFGYEKKIIKHFFKTGDFGCIDLGTHILPAPALLTLWLLLLPIIYGIYALICNVPFDIYFSAAIRPLLASMFYGYIYAFFSALLITILMWKEIKAKPLRKIWHCFTFPLSMLFYLPINTIALFRKNVKWKHIDHTNSTSINEIEKM